LRVLATLSRARRLAEDYTDRINRLFPPRVQELGRDLGIAEHAIKVFCEGDLRGHVVFQLSRLVDVGLQAARQALRLPPWETIVPGEAAGTLVRAAAFADVEGRAGPLVLLLEHADGEAEIPEGIKGLLLGHPMPHLSHLGVRARQARIPFAACADRESLGEYASLAGKSVCLRVAPDGLIVRESSPDASQNGTVEPVRPAVAVPEVVLARAAGVVALDQATPATCGAKAAGAQRLLELAERSGGLFRAPRGLALPFGVMERCLDAVPAARQEYAALQERLQQAPHEELGPLLEQLRALVRALPLPDAIGQAVTAFFPPETRLAVRSSANGEDLEHLAGAGLYDSVVNVPLPAVPAAIAEVWASLWTRRATVSRLQAGIPHARIHMAVLLQELVVPDLSFILHTVNPLTGNRQEALVELAVGLGEVLASAALPGTPYRLACDRRSGTARLEACATFSVALRPALDQDTPSIVPERLDYARVALSADPGAAERLGQRLVPIATVLEEQFGRPQDAEGVCVGEDVYIVQARPQQGL
jgi:phosphoglucan, water dikinase